MEHFIAKGVRAQGESKLNSVTNKGLLNATKVVVGAQTLIAETSKAHKKPRQIVTGGVWQWIELINEDDDELKHKLTQRRRLIDNSTKNYEVSKFESQWAWEPMGI